MCGIIGYVGKKQALNILYTGLEHLEYRGYDSAGIALMDNKNKETHLAKTPGKLKELKKYLTTLDGPWKDHATTGIAHTRWATHGESNQANAHPHKAGPITIVHNGIIENARSLKKESTHYLSNTDSEVFAHMVAEKCTTGMPLLKAVSSCFSQLEGNSAFLVMDDNNPETIIAVRKGASPLVLGKGDKETLVASDTPPILNHTRNVYFLQENEIALLTTNGFQVFNLSDHKEKKISLEHIDWEMDSMDKKGFPHFMLKEIHEQPDVLRQTLQGWFHPNGKQLQLCMEGMDPQNIIQKATNIHLIACGSAWHSTLYGKILLERFAKIPVNCELAHEFRYRNPALQDSHIGIVVSQSGETADTLAAVKLMQSQGMVVFCITNVRGSSIDRACDGTFLMKAGMEIGVASTKALCAMLATFVTLSIVMGRIRNTVTQKEEILWRQALSHLPAQVEKALNNTVYKKLSEKFTSIKGYLFIGRDVYFPMALEGALKIKEIAYVHAEGFAGGELKHGPLALVDNNMLIIVLAPQPTDPTHAKILSNGEEAHARNGKIFGIGSEKDDALSTLSDFFIALPYGPLKELNAIISLIPLQLFSYYHAKSKNAPIDQPRNLAKSVTVE